MSEQLPDSLFTVLRQLDAEGVTGYEKYKRVRRYVQFSAREKRIPVCGHFELTPLCNLSCKMCYVRLDKEQMGGRDLLPAECWISIIDQAVDAGLMYATVTGGECLTYDGFKEVYLHLRSKGVEVSLLTNGVLLTEEMVSFLEAYPPEQIQVTLYGPDEEEYERVTGHRVFRKVMENLERLKAHHLPFTIAVTPNYYMTKGKELIQLLYEKEFPFVINAGLQQPREETGRELLDASLDTYVELYREEKRLGEGNTLMEIPDEDLPDPGVPEGGPAGEERGVLCGAGRSSFCVTWDGRLKPCGMFPGIEEDVLKTGFAAAWERIGRQIMEIKRPVECPGCPYEKVCGRCIVEHMEQGKICHVNPDVCAHTRRFVKEGLTHL